MTGKACMVFATVYTVQFSPRLLHTPFRHAYPIYHISLHEGNTLTFLAMTISGKHSRCMEDLHNTQSQSYDASPASEQESILIAVSPPDSTM